jgi:hypothetical protein
MASYRILITGSRTWDDRQFMLDAISDAVQEGNVWGFPVVVVHGGARGADTLAGEIARELGFREEVHLAQWMKHTDECPAWHTSGVACRMAGHRRNAEMVALGADVCLAFIKDGSKGATGCAELARLEGIPTVRYEVKTGED